MTGTPEQQQTYILKTSARGWQGPVSDLARLLARRFHVPEDALLIALARGEEAVLAAGVGAERAEELAGVLARIGAQPVVEAEGGPPARSSMRRTQVAWASLDEDDGPTAVQPPPDPRALGQAARVAMTPKPAAPVVPAASPSRPALAEGALVLGVTPALSGAAPRPQPRHSLAVPGVPLPATGPWERLTLPTPSGPALATPSGGSSSSQRAARVFSHQEAQAFLEAAQAEPAQPSRVRPISQPTLADPQAALRALEDALVPEGPAWEDATVGQLRRAIQEEAPEPSRAPAPIPGVLEGWAQALQPPPARPKRHDSFEDLWGQIVTPGQEAPVSFDADPHSGLDQSAEVDLGAPPEPAPTASAPPALNGWGALLGPALTTTGPIPAVVAPPAALPPERAATPTDALELELARASAPTPPMSAPPMSRPPEPPALPGVGGWREGGAATSGKGRAVASPVAQGGGREVSPSAALLAGLLVPGGGQALLGELGRAAWFGLGSFLVLPWVWGAWDAKRAAGRRALGEEQGGWRVWGAYALCYVLCVSALVVVGRVAVERRWVLGGDEEKARERLVEGRIVARGAALQGVERAFYRANREREHAESLIDPRTVLKPGDPGYGVSPRVRAEQLAERLEAARTACTLGKADLCEQLAQEALGLEPSSREAWSLVVKARELRANPPPVP